MISRRQPTPFCAPRSMLFQDMTYRNPFNEKFNQPMIYLHDLFTFARQKIRPALQWRTWAPRHLKSPATQLFFHWLFWVTIKNAQHYRPLVREICRWISPNRTKIRGLVESVSFSWRHHGNTTMSELPLTFPYILMLTISAPFTSTLSTNPRFLTELNGAYTGSNPISSIWSSDSADFLQQKWLLDLYEFQ